MKKYVKLYEEFIGKYSNIEVNESYQRTSKINTVEKFMKASKLKVGKASIKDLLQFIYDNFEDITGEKYQEPWDFIGNDFIADIISTYKYGEEVVDQWKSMFEGNLFEARGFTMKEVRDKAIEMFKGMGIKFPSEEQLKDAIENIKALITKHQLGTILESVNEANAPIKDLQKNMPDHVEGWAKYVAQHANGEWWYYEDYPVLVKNVGWRSYDRDGYQMGSDIKTNARGWEKSVQKLKESVNEAEKPLYKKGQKVQYQLDYKGGVGKYADSVSKSQNVETNVILKRKKKLSSYEYVLTNGLTVHQSEIIGLAESHVKMYEDFAVYEAEAAQGKQPVNIMVGRFQPFHNGHYLACKELHEANGNPVVLVTVRGSGKSGKGTAFTEATMDKMMKDVIKKSGFIIDHVEIKFVAFDTQLFPALRPKYEPVLMGAGDDRIDTYERQTQSMRVKHENKLNIREDFAIHLTGRYGSGTAVRQAITDRDQKEFENTMPKFLHGYWDILSKEMGMNEGKMGLNTTIPASTKDYTWVYQVGKKAAKTAIEINKKLNDIGINSFISKTTGDTIGIPTKDLKKAFNEVLSKYDNIKQFAYTDGTKLDKDVVNETNESMAEPLFPDVLKIKKDIKITSNVNNPSDILPKGEYKSTEREFDGMHIYKGNGKKWFLWPEDMDVINDMNESEEPETVEDTKVEGPKEDTIDRIARTCDDCKKDLAKTGASIEKLKTAIENGAKDPKAFESLAQLVKIHENLIKELAILESNKK